MTKWHLRVGSGTACRRVADLTLDRADFMARIASDRCQRCESALATMKRQIFVATADAGNEIAVFDLHPWASVIATVAGGWLAFESISEFHAWEDRQPRTPRRVVFDGRGQPIR